MQRTFEPFVVRRLADGRVFFVNQNMPVENVLDCFQVEHPFFMVAQLEDGRLAITPNSSIIPQNYLQADHRSEDLLPANVEYVTMRTGTCPIIITAHPVNNVDEWLRTFERLVTAFAKQSFGRFVTASRDYVPLGARETVSSRGTPARERETISA